MPDSFQLLSNSPWGQMLSVYLLIRLINWQTKKQVPSILNLLRNKGSTKSCTMSQVSTTCFSKYHLCLKRPSFKLLDSLLQEVCITYLNHLLWWIFLCLWICSIDGSIINKENQFEQTNNCLDDLQLAKLIFFFVIKELSKHVQWAKCRLLVFQRTIFV